MKWRTTCLNALGSSLRENDKESNMKVLLHGAAKALYDCLDDEGCCNGRYWEARFENKEEFDWYCKYLHIRELFVSYVSKTARVLVAGTGTSRLPAEMALDGYSDVVAMDYAANVIKKMHARSEKYSGEFGCLDAMLLKPETDTEETNWKRVTPDSPDDLCDAVNSMQQLARILNLKPDGLLFFLTFGNPSNRVNIFDSVPSDQYKFIEWDILQCLEMSPTFGQSTFVTRFFLFVARKKLK
ncbi:unnamed protein product [Peronospora belbahrii]|uniref:Methyltransferase type 11 domain-containing protein n=1 Tax=Peronospora belbahrii TaxID=622444 RepID=A0ABN8D774_9STRA|nr:unnamed protein product [Peronospora belbahrii]